MVHDHKPVPPVDLSPDHQSLCQVLEDLHRWGMASLDAGERLEKTPTEMFTGAIFAAQRECENNPDWIAQAAHSLREILYPFLAKDQEHSPVPEREWKLYQDFREKSSAGKKMNKLWGRLNEFAHHRPAKRARTLKDFDKLLAKFQETMRHAQPVWAEMYKGLDAVVRVGPDEVPPRRKGE